FVFTYTYTTTIYNLSLHDALPIFITSWKFLDSLMKSEEIEAIALNEYPEAELEFKSWISWDFITSSVSSSATSAGLRTALLGSLDRKSTRLNSSHVKISYAVFCLK